MKNNKLTSTLCLTLMLSFLFGLILISGYSQEVCYYIDSDDSTKCVKEPTHEDIQQILDESPYCDFKVERIGDKCYLKDKNGVCLNFIGTPNPDGECV